jgi:hypothetical protein
MHRREVGQGRFGSRNQNFRRAQEQPALQTGCTGECRHHGELQFGRLHLLGERGAVAFHDPHSDIGMPVDEARQRWRQNAPRHGRHQPDDDVAGKPGTLFANGAGCLCVSIEQLDAVTIVAVAGRRRHHAALVTGEQLGVQRVFQLADVLRHA